jgi:predicted acetyltransferase
VAELSVGHRGKWRIAMVKIVEAAASDKPKFEQLLNQYLSELKIHREFNVGATDSTTYPYLDSYWNEKGRHPYLFYYKNELAGFSFIRDTQSTESLYSQVAEFYIIPEKRGIGIGQKAAFAILGMFPGHWELQVHSKNKAAIGFWEKCIRLKAKYEPNVSRITANDGSRTQYNFEV